MTPMTILKEPEIVPTKRNSEICLYVRLSFVNFARFLAFWEWHWSAALPQGTIPLART